MSRMVCALPKEKSHTPWWLYPNVLSLDAPLVAVLWMYVFAKVWKHQYVEPVFALTLGLVVWIIYTCDRLLDVKIRGDDVNTARHNFHKRHAKKFKVILPLAILFTGFLVLSYLQWNIVISSFLPCIGVAGFFILSFFTLPGKRISYSKNLVAGFSFALGSVAGLVGLSAHDMTSILSAPELLCFAMLCVINITAVDVWSARTEAMHGSDDDIVDEWSLTLPLVVLAFFSLLYKYRVSHEGAQALYDVIVVCAGAMYVLNRMRKKFSPEFLRFAADLIMIVGALIFWLISP